MTKLRSRIASLTELAGAALLVFGVWTLSVTAALIVAGVLLIAAGAVLGQRGSTR